MCIGVFGMTGCAGGYNGLNPPNQSLPAALDQKAPHTLQTADEATGTTSANGSVWQDNAPLVSMFSDQKARRAGDVVTIKITESSAATNKASTATDRASKLSASLDAFFNAEKQFPARQPFLNPFSKVAGGLTSEFEGAGTTRRSGNLDAYITAVVTRVLPNGDLVIAGTREVLINNENQVIQLTGVVRPRDISAANVVLSTYIADARIAYSGTGVVNDRQRPGWLTNLMMAVWPF